MLLKKFFFGKIIVSKKQKTQDKNKMEKMILPFAGSEEEQWPSG
jgi:hypothetical protein